MQELLLDMVAILAPVGVFAQMAFASSSCRRDSAFGILTLSIWLVITTSVLLLSIGVFGQKVSMPWQLTVLVTGYIASKVIHNRRERRREAVASIATAIRGLELTRRQQIAR